MPTAALDLTDVPAEQHAAIVRAVCDGLPVGGSARFTATSDLTGVTAGIAGRSHGMIVVDDDSSDGPGRTVTVRRVAAAGVPQVVGDAASGPGADKARTPGALWRLTEPGRSVEAAVIAVPAGHVVPPHFGPPFDSLMIVLSGGGQLRAARAAHSLHVGIMLWLPARSERSFVAGTEGLRYLSVHATHAQRDGRAPGGRAD